MPRSVRHQVRRARRLVVRQFRDTKHAEHAPLDLDTLALLMQDTKARWYVTGMHSFNHFLGRVLREPHDLDVQIDRDDLSCVYDVLPEWKHYYVDCRAPFRWRGGEVPDDISRVLSRPHRNAPVAVEWLRAIGDGDEWVYRYDHEVRAPWPDDADERGIVFAPPEIPLLYKSRWLRPKDHTDFDELLPHLGTERSTWLADAISRGDENHPWLPRLRQVRRNTPGP